MGMVFDVFLVVVGEGNWIGVAVGARFGGIGLL